MIIHDSLSLLPFLGRGICAGTRFIDELTSSITTPTLIILLFFLILLFEVELGLDVMEHALMPPLPF